MQAPSIVHSLLYTSCPEGTHGLLKGKAIFHEWPSLLNLRLSQLKGLAKTDLTHNLDANKFAVLDGKRLPRGNLACWQQLQLLYCNLMPIFPVWVVL